MSKKKFIEYLEHKNYRPHPAIVEALDEMKFPFNKNSFYTQEPNHLASEEFKRCTEMYLDKTPGSSHNELQHIMALMIVHEDGVRGPLEQLGVSIVREMYDIPDYIKMEATIKWTSEMPDDDSEPCDLKKIKDEKRDDLKNEIEKRRILNSIVHGGAIHQWTSAFFMLEEELNKLNPELIGIYSQYAALINYLNWQHATVLSNLSNEQMKNGSVIIQGYNRIDFRNRKLEAVGLALPVVIHEMSKSVLEYLVSVGLPNHLPPNDIRFILEKADKYKDEFWHYYMGPTLWRGLLKSANVPSQDLPKIISYMAKLDYEELSRLCIKMTFDSEETGITAMNKIKKELNIK